MRGVMPLLSLYAVMAWTETTVLPLFVEDCILCGARGGAVG